MAIDLSVVRDRIAELECHDSFRSRPATVLMLQALFVGCHKISTRNALVREIEEKSPVIFLRMKSRRETQDVQFLEKFRMKKPSTHHDRQFD